MKFIIDKVSLLKSINIAESVISSKNINTILSNCLFNISKNQIEIISTDNEIAVRTKILCDTDSAGSFTANGKKLSNLLNELPDDDIILEISDSMVIDIKSESKEVIGHYSLVGTVSDDYPEVQKFDENNSIEIEQSVLKEMIKKSVYAASVDTIKPVFNGLYFITESKGNLTTVATDSRRLSIITRSMNNDILIEDGIIIPLKTVNEIYRLLESSGMCKFSLNNNQCFLKIGNTEIISKVVNEQFPNYKQVVPKEKVFEAVIDRHKFMNSVKRAMIFTREPSYKIILHFNKDKLIIEAKTPELGEAEEEISIELNKNEKISLGLNAQFLIESLKEFNSSTIKCGITGEMSPVTFETEDDSDYISVIMPIRVK